MRVDIRKLITRLELIFFRLLELFVAFGRSCWLLLMESLPAALAMVGRVSVLLLLVQGHVGLDHWSSHRLGGWMLPRVLGVWFLVVPGLLGLLLVKSRIRHILANSITLILQRNCAMWL